MIIGVPKEVKDNESRVGLTPKWVRKLTMQGHEVLIQKGLGELAGIEDADYVQWGAEIVPTADDIYIRSGLVVKLKDYMPEERELPFQEGQVIACFFHLGENEPDQPMLDKLLASKITGVSFELIQNVDGTRPIIKPMSEIAGRLSVLLGCQYCQLPYGKGVSLASITGVEKPKIVILGGGNCGLAAADIAEGLHARTIVFESSYPRLEYLRGALKETELLLWDREECGKQIMDADLLINAIYPYPGMETPLITTEMVASMRKGSVMVDLTGCGIIETMRYTTIAEPAYIEEGVVHICVDNLPALVPATSCEVFAQSIFPYIEAIANKGIKEACRQNAALARSMSFINGVIVHKDIAETHNMPYVPFGLEMLDD
jgi:alanine dehydrogenase